MSILADLQVLLSENYDVQWYANLTQIEAVRNGQGKINYVLTGYSRMVS